MSEYKVGDFITVINEPPSEHWLSDTERRTFRLTHFPTEFSEPFGVMWSTDGGLFDPKDKFSYKGLGYGIKEEWFRLATPGEISKTYIQGNMTKIEYSNDIDLHIDYLKRICPTPTPERQRIIDVLLNSIHSHYGSKRH
jgi:hypothetical protein